MKILQKLTRTISAFFVVWLLESLAKRITTVIRKLKNCFKFNQYCEHLKSNLKIEGVELTDFPQLEKYYETRLFTMF